MKQITGNEAVAVRMKFQNGTNEFKIGALHFIATNEPPKVHGADNAYKRRLIVVPFNERHKRVDNMLGHKLDVLARPAIVYWALKGWAMYLEARSSDEYDGRLRTILSEKVQEESKEFGENTTDIGEFFNEALVRVGWNHEELGTRKNPNHEYKQTHCITKRSAYDVWQRYCKRNDVPEAEYKGLKRFYAEMNRQGIESGRVSLPQDDGKTVQVDCFLGVQIHDDWLGTGIIQFNEHKKGS